MNRIYLLILITCLFSQVVEAQNATHYSINIGTFVDAKAADFASLKSIGFLHAKPMQEGNLSQVFLGGYANVDQAKADLAKVQRAGYVSAYLEENFPRNGQNAAVIQIASMRYTPKINWDRFAKAGNLNVMVDGSLLRILVGPYSNSQAARQDIAKVRQAGFKDAFIKSLNTIYLNEVKAFESEGTIKKPLIPIDLNESTASLPPTDAPSDYGLPPGVLGEPQGDATAMTPKSGGFQPATNQPSTSKAVLPNIRGKIKRRSALELQKVLKEQGNYASGLDGYYGNGTKSAYEDFGNTNTWYQRYKLLAKAPKSTTDPNTGDRLQRAINGLPSNPAGVEGYPHYVAKAYQAYVLFNNLGPSNSVNNLMSSALREAYDYLSPGLSAGFDHRASYAYNDLDQLIRHIFYVHGAQNNSYTIPCWLQERHSESYARAKADPIALPATSRLQTCFEAPSWDELQLLATIAEDFVADAQPNQAKIAEGATASDNLFGIQQPLSPSLSRETEQWNTALWQKINIWANQDPLHKKMTAPLKVAYFQAQVRLEDYFMDKGFRQNEASALALASLRARVGYQLERFVP